jgi:hypothetical protein
MRLVRAGRGGAMGELAGETVGTVGEVVGEVEEVISSD